ncbi:hypothetical protein BDR06DRAFT_1013383 [Suillus hirtellus]|nr:hypothetical protein BDR06DRAFT_1013383 [Suillus hirtellus]
MIAAVEDAMAIQQNAQVMGPPRLVQPKPHMVVSSKNSTNLENMAVTAVFDVDFDDEEYFELLAAQERQDLVHLVERPRDASRGNKCSLQSSKEADYTNLEELELLEDPEAAEDGDELCIGNAAMMMNDNGCTDQKAEVIETWHTSLFGKPGYVTALVLAAAAAEHALVLVQGHLLIDSDPSNNGGETHQILQTLNEAMNKMSHMGTAFSSGNWETDTKAYIKSIKELPYSHIQEILAHAEEYMKHPRHNRHSVVDESGSSQSIPLVNKCACLRICNFILFVFFFIC